MNQARRWVLFGIISLAGSFFGGLVVREKLRDAAYRANARGAYETSLQYHSIACTMRSVASCYALGIQYRQGQGTVQDLPRAATLYRDACEAGEFEACTNLGFLYNRGLGVAKDENEALALYSKGCLGKGGKTGDPVGCTNATETALQMGNHEVSVRFAKLACEADEMAGCLRLGQAYHGGDGVPRDETKSARFFEKACAQKLGEACFDLGINDQTGALGPKNETAARGHYEEACDAGYAAGCTNLGFSRAQGLGGPTDLPSAKLAWRAGCEAGDGKGCVVLSKLMLTGDGGPRERVAALALLERSCEGGSGEACLHQGLAIADSDPARALELYEAACEKGQGSACLARANASPTDTAVLARLRLALDRNLKLDPHARDLLASRGLFSMLDGHDAEGLADYDQLLEADPADAAALNNRAWLKVITADFAGARADADRSVALNAEANSFGTRCFALAGLGELEKAREDCTRASKLNPADHFSRGMLAFFDKHETEARREWDQAVRDSPSDGRAVRFFVEKLQK